MTAVTRIGADQMAPPHRSLARIQAQGPAPLRIALMNLMPTKQVTERHFRRAFAASRRPVDWVLTHPDGYQPTTTAAAHLARYYTPWSRLDLHGLDGLIVTGAPVEQLPFEEVRYWPSLLQCLDRARELRLPSLFVCWGAQAALYRYHGVPKRPLPEKCFGVFEQRLLTRDAEVLRGLPERFYMPVSRHSEVRAEDLPRNRGLEILASSADSGLCLLAEHATRALYIFNHFEYEAETLQLEYERDLAAGRPIAPPRNLASRRLPGGRPIDLWSQTAIRFFSNWKASLQCETQGMLAWKT